MIKRCVVCGSDFKVTFKRRSAKTCSVECGKELKNERRRAYLAIYSRQNRSFIRAQNAAYYQKIRVERLKKTSDMTAASSLVRGLIRNGVVAISMEMETVAFPSCAVCGAAFQPKTKSTLCGRPDCSVEWGRLCARKRHHGEPLPARPAYNIRQAARPEGCAERIRDYQRVWRRQWRDRNPGADKAVQQRSYAKRVAALKIYHEFQSKGLEALL